MSEDVSVEESISAHIRTYTKTVPLPAILDGQPEPILQPSKVQCRRTHYEDVHQLAFQAANRTIIDETMYTRKVNLPLTPNQVRIFSHWMDCADTTHNALIRPIRREAKEFLLRWEEWVKKNDGTKEEVFPGPNYWRDSIKDIRADIVEQSKQVMGKKDYTRAHVLVGAVEQLVSNVKGGLTRLKKEQIKTYRVRPLKEGRRYRVISIEKQYLTGGSICGTGLEKIKCSEIIRGRRVYWTPEDWKKDNFGHALKIRHDRVKQTWTLLVPVTRPAAVPLPPPSHYISIDPGMRVHLTGITNCEVLEYGVNLEKMIDSYQEKVRRLKNRRVIHHRTERDIRRRVYNQGKGKRLPADRVRKTRRSLRAATRVGYQKPVSTDPYPPMDARHRKRLIRRLRDKLRNRIEDYHWQVASQLAKGFAEVYMGNLSTGSIKSKGRNNWSGDYKNKVGMFNHYMFKKRLAEKCQQHGTLYQEVHEGYTSKLCTNCGHPHPKLGDNKTYHCVSCGYTADRDVNAARNIYLKRNYQLAKPSGGVTTVTRNSKGCHSK